MKRSSAVAGARPKIVSAAMAPNQPNRCRLSMIGPLSGCAWLPQQFAGDEGGRLRRGGAAEEVGGGPLFEQAALVQEDDLVGEAPRLAEIVRGHDDLGAAEVDGGD